MNIVYEYRYRLIIFVLSIVFISTCGLFSVAAREYSPIQAKLMAKRAARADALRKLTEIIYGTRVDSETVVKDMVIESDSIRLKINGLVRGAVQVDYHFYEDLSAEVTMEIEMASISDILGTTVQYSGKKLTVTGYGAPPDMKLENTNAITAKKAEKAETEIGRKEPHRQDSIRIEHEPGNISFGPTDLPIPTVSILSPQKKDISVFEDRIRVKAVARSINSEPLTDIWIMVNGMRMDHKKRGIGIVDKDIRNIEGSHAEIDATVYLSVGYNRIEVIASNANGESVPEMLQVTWKGFAGERGEGATYKPDLYVLSIGVSDYEEKGSGLELEYAHEDAAAITDALEGQSGGLYKGVYSRLLTNKDANRVNVLDGLNWVLKESTQKDTTVIFVAGHGVKDERGNYYFLPHDGNPDRPWENGVKWFDFQDTVASLPSKVILMVDTCHSGSVTGKGRRGVVDMTEALQQLIKTGSGVVVMAASTGKESSHESSEWGHGAFTKALLEGVDGKADYDDDTVISIKELDLYITNRVKEITNGAQHPTTEVQKTLPDFPFVIK